MTTAALPTVEIPAKYPPQPKSTAALFIELCQSLVPPQLMDMRARAAAVAKAGGASNKVVEDILALPLFVAAKKGSAE